MYGFPGSSAGKGSVCNAGDPSSIPGSERSLAKGIGYPLQYSWASLVAQLVKNLHTMQETWVRSLGWEDPLRRAWQPTPVYLPVESSWTEEPSGRQSKGSQRVGHDSDQAQHRTHLWMHVCVYTYIWCEFFLRKTY